jgi:hypothetical protein
MKSALPSNDDAMAQHISSKQACFRLLAQAAAGGKNRSFRAAPNLRAHTGLQICLDVKNIGSENILGLDILGFW